SSRFERFSGHFQPRRPSMKLYNNSFSPNAKRIRAMANEIGVKLDIVDVDFAKGDNQKPEYLAKNPMGKIPTFEDDDGYVLWESPAALVYLAAGDSQSTYPSS